MIQSTKNYIQQKSKIKNTFYDNLSKLLSVRCPKNKNFQLAFTQVKEELLKLSKKKYRNIAKNEQEKNYNLRKNSFKKKIKNKIQNKIEILFKLYELSYESIRPTTKINSDVKYAKYWGFKNKKYIPYSMENLKKHKRKKISVAHSLYLLSIQRWTNLSEQRAKIFMSALNPINSQKNRYHSAKILQTYKVGYDGIFSSTNNFTKKLKNLKLNLVQKKKYKKLKILRKRLLSKLPNIAFKHPGKFTKPYKILTKKQIWLTNKFVWLNIKKQRKKQFGIDFFKTILGQVFLTAHKTSKNKFLQKHLIWNVSYMNAMKVKSYFKLTRRNLARKFQAEQKRAWFYTNSVFPKKLPYYFQKNSINKIYPFNKFIDKWYNRGRAPWLHSLISKRILYSGFLTTDRRELKWIQKFSWIPHLRNKIAVFQKKNKLYFQRKRLLTDKNNRQVVRTDKKARIKQILAKSTLPFYGHLRLKQFAKIKQKAQIKKSNYLSRDDIQLGYLERRLDVIVYRLNLAPNIFWARKLIQDGSIFVSASGINQSKSFEKMHANYKQNAYPLKLRDPLTLYKKTAWNFYDNKINNYNWKLTTKLKFLLEPLRNINYLTQPGDVILCAPGALNNQYKSNKILWQKPIPTHLLSYSNITETKTAFKSRYNQLAIFSRKEQTTTNVGIVVFNPSFTDLHKTDRIQRSFIRWISL